MTRRIFIITSICLLSLCNIPTAKALFLREYTEERPLIIVSDWEFPPYEFRNDQGAPDGYNVEVLDLILNNLQIPHQFVMKEWYQCTEAFENREADLIHALTFPYKQRPYVMTQNMITYYKLRVARHRSTPPLEKISQLKDGDTLILKRNDYAALRISEIKDYPFKTEYHSSREALTGIRSGKYKYYIWGEYPLKMKIKEYGVDEVELDEIDIPAGELRIIGYDKELIDAIDDTFARLEQSGQLEKIHDKWFYPERVHNDTSPITLLILLGIIAAGVGAFLLSLLLRNRIKAAVNKSIDLNHMMTQAMNMGEFAIMEYDISNNILTNRHGHILPEKGINMEDFISLMKPEQGFMLSDNNHRLIRGEKKGFDISVSLNSGTADKPDWKEYYGKAFIEVRRGRPKYIIYAVKDTTEEYLEETQTKELGSKYLQMFKTNMIAMSFYDSQGNLIDVNDKMRELCDFNDNVEKFFRNSNLFDNPLLEGQINENRRELFHVCQRMFYPELGIHKYIELKVRPTFDENGNLRFYIVTSRDLSTERHIYMEQRFHIQEISKANKTIMGYEEQLNYLLGNSKMFIFNYFPEKDLITFTQAIHKNEYKESLDEFFDGIEQGKQKAINEVKACVAELKPYNAVHHYTHTPLEKRPVWYAISGIPTFDKAGNLIKYFGFARNISDLMDAQQKLKEETKRAEDSGKMKSAFLANMTHEIRTPLNAIVGFSDLLPMVDTNEERMEFIRIIRNNCDILMRLINDILAASNMGQALAIKPTEVDLATVFNDICQTLAMRVQEAGVEFIKDNPYDTYPAFIDAGRLQQVLTNFTTNAVKYTNKGYIKVGYREQDGGLYFYCEDTGSGIPKEKQGCVFDRFVKLDDFVQGTGLGLSICKAIAERSGGKIGIESDGEGCGSTFWIWIPKEVTPSINN